MSGQKSLAVGHVHAERFFHEEVQTGFEHGDADGRVRWVWGAAEHGVDGSGRDHVVDVGEAAFARVFGQGGHGGGAAADGGHGEAGDFAIQNILAVSAAHISEANDAESDFLHDGEWRQRVGAVNPEGGGGP